MSSSLHWIDNKIVDNCHVQSNSYNEFMSACYSRFSFSYFYVFLFPTICSCRCNRMIIRQLHVSENIRQTIFFILLHSHRLIDLLYDTTTCLQNVLLFLTKKKANSSTFTVCVMYLVFNFIIWSYLLCPYTDFVMKKMRKKLAPD